MSITHLVRKLSLSTLMEEKPFIATTRKEDFLASQAMARKLHTLMMTLEDLK